MTVHGLRHTLTSLLNQYGVNSKIAQEILGHTNQKMTSHYTHSYLEEQRKAIQLINEKIINI